ncbi:hypothetical protein E3T54_02745 [Cryobacterium sp. Sr8]|uniref:hypothetical protein n=1 Tax=Cryobacterium sp. Sr8 TaxID=1259203 RepID=UPI00106A23E2|nr:hypothetical protein [Cryobacterium sp. Sr8]TFD80677.1 hypothetical protein E3T54_02745 [Cryobacterium sp. Sr8]
MTKDNAELIKRARYFHADDLGGLVLPLADALEAAEAERDAAIAATAKVRSEALLWSKAPAGIGYEARHIGGYVLAMLTVDA